MKKDENEPGSHSSIYRAQGVEIWKSPDASTLTKDNIRRKYRVQFERLDGPSECIIKGRDIWALRELVRAGAVDATPINYRGPRWSAYVHNLRAVGLYIETVRETHGGPYRGTHARYVLHTPIKVIEIDGCDGPAS